MQVKALDHVNIVTADIAAASAFYSALLDLTPDPRIPATKQDTVAWLCDEGGRAIIHLNAVSLPRAFDRAFPPGAETGAIHHVALACADRAAMIERLEALGLAYETAEVPHAGLRQIFVRDPHNVLLELNFYSAN
jgi:catechol 2,3-dioxygenase-like lactoylglutathione lyase family enzyme